MYIYKYIYKVLLAQALGAVIHLPDPNSSGRTLEDTQREATEYANKDPNRFQFAYFLPLNFNYLCSTLCVYIYVYFFACI
jgi:hypothetical protein